MSVPLTNNFFLNARGLTFGDTASVTWTFNKNTNTLSASAAGAPSGANPTGSVKLTQTNGTALTFLPSDAAPKLDQTIAPTWTGIHLFSGAVAVSSVASAGGVYPGAAGSQGILVIVDSAGGADSKIWDIVPDATTMHFRCVNDAYSGANDWLDVTRSGASPTGAKFFVPIGVNGASPPAQSTGWGTPVGGAVVASYNITDAGGANSNTNKALAQVIAVLKANGFLGT